MTFQFSAEMPEIPDDFYGYFTSKLPFLWRGLVEIKDLAVKFKYLYFKSVKITKNFEN